MPRYSQLREDKRLKAVPPTWDMALVLATYIVCWGLENLIDNLYIFREALFQKVTKNSKNMDRHFFPPQTKVKTWVKGQIFSFYKKVNTGKKNLINFIVLQRPASIIMAPQSTINISGFIQNIISPNCPIVSSSLYQNTLFSLALICKTYRNGEKNYTILYITSNFSPKTGAKIYLKCLLWYMIHIQKSAQVQF